MSLVRRHSPLAHAAYIDLLRLLREDDVSELRGAPILKTRAGRGFWYDSYRVGRVVKSRYIGPDTPDMRQRLARLEALKQEREARATQRRRLVRILRAEGFLSLDAGTGSLLSALAAAGTFRLGGTVVGTHAFRLYEGELGVRLALDQAALTQDIDVASFERLSLALGDVASPALADVLADMSFSPVPSLEHGKVWRWRQSESGTLVEFLTPSFVSDEGVRELPALGVHARALHHLNFLIAEPIPAAVMYRSGILLQIPRPERFAIHKLIVADRRLAGPDAGKAAKDLMQASLLIAALAEDRPDDLAEAYHLAVSAGAKWKARIDASLGRIPDTDKLLKRVTSARGFP